MAMRSISPTTRDISRIYPVGHALTCIRLPPCSSRVMAFAT
jgi:hypothetical protein